MIGQEASLVAPEPLQQLESLDNPKVHSKLLGNQVDLTGRQTKLVGCWSVGCSPTNWHSFLSSSSFFSSSWSKEVIVRGKQKRFPNSHLAARPTFMSLFGDSDSEFL